jgi:biopolymer transport protein ExbD
MVIINFYFSKATHQKQFGSHLIHINGIQNLLFYFLKPLLMTEVNIPQLGKKRTSPPRVDMTPMVDLGFLLITFFMLTSALKCPIMMPVIKPAKSDIDPPELKCSRTLTLKIESGDNIKYQICPDDKQDSTTFTKQGIRNLISKRQAEVADKWGNKDQLVVLVKVSPNATYGHFIDLIDEMKIMNAQFVLCDNEL